MKYTISLILLCSAVLSEKLSASSLSNKLETVGVSLLYEPVTQYNVPVLQLETIHTVRKVTFSADGSKLAIATEGSVSISDGMTGELIRILPIRTVVTKVAFNPDGTRLFTETLSGQVALWEIATGNLLLEWSNSTGAYSPDGSIITTGSADGSISLWDTSSGKNLETFQVSDKPVKVLLFSPNGSLLAAGDPEGTMRLWDLGTKKITHTFSKAGHIAAFSPDGASLLTASIDNAAKLWDVSTGTLRTTLQHKEEVLIVSFSPDGRLALTSSANTVQIWNDTNEPTVLEKKFDVWSKVKAAVFSPDSKRVVVGSGGVISGFIDIHNLITGKKITLPTSTPPTNSGDVTSLDFSSDGTRVAVGLKHVDDYTTQIFELEKGNVL